MKIIEHFISIQGEGKRTGRPSLFIRLAGCNLRCVFRGKDDSVASICDTSYASFKNPKAKESEEEALATIYNILSTEKGITDVVITGGEPLLNRDSLIDMLREIKTINEDLYITIETNGSIAPTQEMYKYVDLWSVSPKLESSTPREEDKKKYGLTQAQINAHRDKRINYAALVGIVDNGQDVQLKFVYSNADVEKEIDDIVGHISDTLNQSTSINGEPRYLYDVGDTVNGLVMLMPEGITEDAILGKSDEVVKVCIRRGWTYTTRMHILIWGNVKEK